MSTGPDATATVAVRMTVFVDRFAQTKHEELVDLPALSRKLRATNAGSKHKLPLLKLATFGDFRTSYDCLRSDANVSALTGIEADYDGERVSFEGYPLPPAKFSATAVRSRWSPSSISASH